MQLKDAAELRKKWGSKYCNHPSVQPEYCMSMDTGDVVCEQCGQTFWHSKWEEIKQLKAEGKPIPQPTPPEPSNYPYIIEIEYDDGDLVEALYRLTPSGKKLKRNMRLIREYSGPAEAESDDPPDWQHMDSATYGNLGLRKRPRPLRWRKIRPPKADRSKIPWEDCK